MQNSIGQDASFRAVADAQRAERAKKVSEFADECRFAKIVETAEGPAILINGVILSISSPDPEIHTEALVMALRRGGTDTVQEVEPSGPINGDGFNAAIQDVIEDLEEPRPISAGGTGAARAHLELGQQNYAGPMPTCNCHDCTQARRPASYPSFVNFANGR